MAYLSLVDKAQEILAQVIQPGDFVIDATVGNGYDTMFLAKAVGDTGQVLGFDVQPQAIENARRLLHEENLHHRVKLLLQSHSDWNHYIPDIPIKAVMFNLGYLPGGDKSVTTNAQSTFTALNSVLPRLQSGGAISVIAYRGHAGGAHEAGAVVQWSLRLDPAKYTVETIQSPTSSDKAPVLIIIKT